MIIRLAKRTRYTIVPNQLIEDRRLSFRARGVLLWLLSKPDDWKLDREVIAAAGTEGVSAVRNVLNELASCGYLERRRKQLEDGRWVTEVWVYEAPKADIQPSVNRPSVHRPSARQPSIPLGLRAITEQDKQIFPDEATRELGTEKAKAIREQLRSERAG